MKIHRCRLAALLALSTGLVGCDDPLGPVDSIPMTLTINSMNSSDIDPPGSIQKDENISTETGNPWGEFIRQAETVCGRDPVGFSVRNVSISLDVPGSSDVSVFEDVISGTATVFFASTRGSDANAVRVDVASGGQITGTGPVSLPVIATRSQLDTLLERMLGGDFHVGFQAATDRLETESFSMDVRVTVQSAAICE